MFACLHCHDLFVKKKTNINNHLQGVHLSIITVLLNSNHACLNSSFETTAERKNLNSKRLDLACDHLRDGQRR